jgi:hypothetical protein
MERRLKGNHGQHPLLSGVLALMLVTMMAAGAALTGGPSVARAQSDNEATASIVPDSALVYVSMDLNTQSPQWTQASALLQKLGMSGSVEEMLNKAASEAAGTPVAGAGDLQPFLGGQAAIVITSLAAAQRAEEAGAPGMGTLGGVMSGLGAIASPAVGTTGEPGGFALVAKPGDVDQAWTKAQALLRETGLTRAVTITEETYQGVAIRLIPPDPSSDADGIAMAKVDDFIVVATTPDEIHPFIDVQQGKGKALSSVDAFTKLQSALNEAHLMFGYINNPALLSAGMAEAGSTAGMGNLGSSITQQYNAFTGFVVVAQQEGFRFDALSAPAPGATLPPVPASYEPQLPTKLPSTTSLLLDGMDLGANGVLDQLALLLLQGMMQGAQPGVEGTPASTPTPDELFAQSAAMLGFNLKTDFIDQLTGEYGLAIWGAETMDPSQINGLFVSGAKDPATLKDTLSKISLLVQSAAQGQVTVASTPVAGERLNVIDLSSATGMPSKLEYGVIGQEFLLGYNDAIAQYQAGTTDTLASNATYQAALAPLPADHNSVFFVNLEQLVPLFQQLSASMETGTSTPTTPMPDLTALRALAGVGYEQDGMRGESVLLLIGG